jgi:hypothetical protein
MPSMGITLTPRFRQGRRPANATLMRITLCCGMMPLLALGGHGFQFGPALMAGMVLVGALTVDRLPTCVPTLLAVTWLFSDHDDPATTLGCHCH